MDPPQSSKPASVVVRHGVAESLSPAKSQSGEAYINAVIGHSRRSKQVSLFPGVNYRQLASFLTGRYQNRKPASPTSVAQQTFSYAVLHNLAKRPDDPDRVKPVEGTMWPGLDQNIRATTDAGENHLLFLCEATRHRTGYLSVGPTSLHYDLPALPSASQHIVTVDFCSLGRCTIPCAKRPDAAELMREYYQAMGAHPKLGKALVRDFFWHNEEHFSIKQRISICLSTSVKHQNWTAIVMLDNGRDLFEDHCKPWTRLLESRQPLKEIFYPTIQIKRKIALEDESLCSLSASKADQIATHHQTMQSAGLLSTSLYGRDLNQELMQLDPFYALHGIFAFCSAAENQFLNLIWSVLQAEAGQPETEAYQGTSLLRFKQHEQLLQDRISSLRSTLAYVRERGAAIWPHTRHQNPSEKQKEELSQAEDMLVKDFTYLIRRAEELVELCRNEIQNVRNMVSLAESRKGVEQARGVARLTSLAFIFIPMSFTTSFFGMNFKELGTGGLSLWIWFAVTIPVCIFTLGTGMSDAWLPLRKYLKSLSKRPRDQIMKEELG